MKVKLCERNCQTGYNDHWLEWC